METALLGTTAISVSRLCLGGWQATGWISSDEKRFVDVMRKGFERGINFVDTAEGYGDGVSEELIAKAIGANREKIVIATKFSHNHSAPDDIRKALEKSLKRLRTDYIDLYQQHWPPKKPPLMETLAELDKLKKEGKIRAVGVSNWMEPEFTEIDNPARIDALQPCHSLLWRNCERNILPLCRKFNIAYLPYSPLCQSILANRLGPVSEPPRDHRKRNALLHPSKRAQLSVFLHILSSVAHDYNKTPAQVAVRWLLDIPGVTSVIVGASNVVQLEENLGALDWNLSKESWDLLSEKSAGFSEGLKPHDTLWNWHPRET